MYKDNSQLRIEDFVFPYGTLDPENDWVKLAALVPWDTVEQRYAVQFVNNGHLAHPARMAFGALLIKQRLKCSDEWVVKHISENPYLQYFIGMKEYGSSCLGASTMVAFRKRFTPEDIAEILEATIPKPDDAGNSGRNDDDQNPPNGGTLTMDATCCPADIAYPQDIELLSGVREQLECVIDQVCDSYGLKKARTYRKRARKDYLNLVKRKKRGTQVIRKAIRKQQNGLWIRPHCRTSEGDDLLRHWGAGRKILCKRFSTKSRMALESRADSGLDSLITESHGGQNGMRAGTA